VLAEVKSVVVLPVRMNESFDVGLSRPSANTPEKVPPPFEVSVAGPPVVRIVPP